jgi:large subunit ribosomal protein L4
MNITARRTALFSALSKKIADGEFYVIDEIAVAEGKTKEMVAFKEAFKFEKTVLVVMDNADEKVIRAARNIEKMQTLPVSEINTYDVVKNAVVVLSKGSVEKLQEVYGE